MNRKYFALAAIVLSVAILLCCKGEEKLFVEGTGMVPYACQGANAGKTVDIYYHIPAGDIRTMPVQIVIHIVQIQHRPFQNDQTNGLNSPINTASYCWSPG